MRRTMQLSQLPRRPSEIWNLAQSGLSPERCLDFDFAVLDFWDWFQHKSEEKVIVKDRGKQPKKGETWGHKYPTVEDVLKQYYAERDVSRTVSAEFEEFIANELEHVLDDVFGEDDLM